MAVTRFFSTTYLCRFPQFRWRFWNGRHYLSARYGGALCEPTFCTRVKAVNSRIRVLTIRNEASSNIAQWRELYSACTNLEVVHVALHGSLLAIDILTLISRKFESLKSVTTMTFVMGISDVNPKNDIVDVVARNLTTLNRLSYRRMNHWRGGCQCVVRFTLPVMCENLTLLLHEIGLEASSGMRDRDCEKLKGCAQLTQLDIADMNLESFSTHCQSCFNVYAEAFRHVCRWCAVSHLVRRCLSWGVELFVCFMVPFGWFRLESDNIVFAQSSLRMWTEWLSWWVPLCLSWGIYSLVVEWL